MRTTFQFNTHRMLLAILFFGGLVGISLVFIIRPELFLRNVYSMKIGAQLIGTISLIYSFSMTFSLLWVMMMRKGLAFQVVDDGIIDRIRYESLGRITWDQINSVERIGKNTIEIVLKEPVSKNWRLSPEKKLLHLLNNWNYNNSILITSALIDTDIHQLESAILEGMIRHANRKRKKL